MILTDSVEIRASPREIIDWLIHFEENYKKWHPDHRVCTWLKGTPMEEGSILYIEEYIHGDLHKIKFRLTRIEPRKIEYEILFPLSIICQGGSFAVVPRGDHCEFTATLSLRLGRVLSFLFKRRVEALGNHMREEGENLKRLLERRK